MYGIRTSFIGDIAGFIATFIRVFIGSIAGYKGRIIEEILMGITKVLITISPIVTHDLPLLRYIAGRIAIMLQEKLLGLDQ